MTLYDRLIKAKDDEYRAFQTKLVPGIPPEAILYNADGSEALRGTFAEAWAAISADGQILEIKANVTAESVLSVNKELTIRDDGTARTVKIAAAENGFAVEPGKTLTVTGSENGGLNFTCGSDSIVFRSMRPSEWLERGTGEEYPTPW